MLSQLGLRHMTRVKRSKTLGVACEACFVPVMQKIQINRLFTLIRIYHSLFSGSLRSLLSAWHRSLQIRKQAAQNRLRKLRPRACSACFVPVLQKMQITPLFYVEPYFCTWSLFPLSRNVCPYGYGMRVYERKKHSVSAVLSCSGSQDWTGDLMIMNPYRKEFVKIA